MLTTQQPTTPVLPSAPSTITTRTADIGGLMITSDERVLEPRPWTALQGIWASTVASSAPAGPILELCSGAGHIGLVAISRCDRSLVQVDVDPVACGFAELNARSAGLHDRVETRCCPLEELDAADGLYPVIIADPPYLPTADAALFSEDPLLAIDGGADGLHVVHACLESIDRLLAPGGTALLQLGRSEHVRQLRSRATRGLVVADHKADRWDRHVVLLRRSVNH